MSLRSGLIVGNRVFYMYFVRGPDGDRTLSGSLTGEQEMKKY
jgi:hypothetical protein